MTTAAGRSGGQAGDQPRQRLDPAGRGTDDDELGSVLHTTAPCGRHLALWAAGSARPRYCISPAPKRYMSFV